MTDDHEVSEKAGGHDPSQEDPASTVPRGADGEDPAQAAPQGGQGEGSAPAAPQGEKGPVPAAPRGVDGESRVVAERSGADTSFPERPLLADPDDARDSAGADEESGKGVPEPKVGPTS
ncbi:hypothetical protein [Streptosporangium roseum]|uniref:hypothetical protein n=1 Tax=Streptosporangium roseum TaxID=2001 RepID=UPI0004CD120F|nr:hypothetical protein [Streptosporangium roseum]